MADKKTNDAIEIIHQALFESEPERLLSLTQARINAKVAKELYDLRTKTRLTQTQFATFVGVTTGTIRDLEDADFDGNSLAIFKTIVKVMKEKLNE